MARKNKNENLKDIMVETRASKKKEGSKNTSSEPIHSIGILPHLMQPVVRPKVELSFDERQLRALKVLYKKLYGFKPTGMTAEKICEVVAQHRGVKESIIWEEVSG